MNNWGRTRDKLLKAGVEIVGRCYSRLSNAAVFVEKTLWVTVLAKLEMEEGQIRFGLKSDVIDKLHRIFQRYPKVEMVLIYGSRAIGNYRPGSDIDLTIKGNELQWKDLQSIELDIDELFLPYKIDLSLYDQIDNKEPGIAGAKIHCATYPYPQ